MVSTYQGGSLFFQTQSLMNVYIFYLLLVSKANAGLDMRKCIRAGAGDQSE